MEMLIIDDRTKRQEIDLGKGSEHDLYNMLISLYPAVSFCSGIKSFSELDSFKYIAVHRSFVVQNLNLEDLISYIQKTDKYLILFSGGINEKTVGLDGHYLSLNSKFFYSDRLVKFVEYIRDGEVPNLYQLLHGQSWKLPLLLRYRHLKWQGPTTDDDINWMEEIEEILPETENVDESIESLLRSM